MTVRENGWLIGLALALASSVACERQPGTALDRERGLPTADRAEDRDDRITKLVQARFYTDDQIRGRHIEVHTDEGVVTLRGTVDTEERRQHARELAQGVEGVQRVEDNLRVGEPVATTGVDPMAPMAPRTGPAAPDHTEAADRREAGDAVNPAWITTKIQAQYFVTPGVAPWNVDVTTTAGGVVSLEGEVDTAENRQRAVQVARDTDGVTRVEDRLRVRGARDETAATTGAGERDRAADAGMDPPDAWITTKVQSKYFLDDDVRGRRIDVTTDEGIVTLRGTVDAERERRQAVALARNTDGVTDVRDELTIQPAADADRDAQPGRTGEPGAMPRDARSPAGQPMTDRDRPGDATIGERVDDGWITTKVQSQLYLEQDVRGRRIEVQTRDGVVTLSGQVDADAERQLAEQIARDIDGVRRVENQIKVGGHTP